MLQKALTPSMQCCAFSKSDKRRCRLERESEKLTCHIHRNYYTNWLEKCKPIFKWESLSSREKDEIIFQISNRYVEIPEEIIKSLSPGHIGFFKILMQYTDHSPLLNYFCLNNFIEKIISDVKYYNEIEFVIKDPKSAYMTIYILQKSLVYFSNESIEQYFSLLTNFTDQENFRNILYSSYNQNIFKANRDFFTMVTPFFPELFTPGLWDAENGHIRKWIIQFNSVHSKRLLQRISVFKEELLANAWHPSRVNKWLESGKDPEDL